MNCLLAPVPVVHLPDAKVVAATGKPVAFGSNAFDILERLKSDGAVGILDVYIAVSATGLDTMDNSDGFAVGKVQFRGKLSAIVRANKRGKHDDESKRPESALKSDGPWGMFWEVSDFEEIEPLPITKFSTRSGTAWKSVPEGPVEAHLGS